MQPGYAEPVPPPTRGRRPDPGPAADRRYRPDPHPAAAGAVGPTPPPPAGPRPRPRRRPPLPPRPPPRRRGRRRPAPPSRRRPAPSTRPPVPPPAGAVDPTVWAQRFRKVRFVPDKSEPLSPTDLKVDSVAWLTDTTARRRRGTPGATRRDLTTTTRPREHHPGAFSMRQPREVASNPASDDPK